ncbi:MAG: sigma 54-interacting transcriptional regulator [Desulfovibrio sp.]|uniref:sigma 54-interacting transcriptional regulator n=1 Tax=Desulfovibrio sp. 7SRBS1 TaxID=3378064 RepID=UPI003B40F089
MARSLKFKLLFEDRIGIVYDVARLMVDQGLNIVSMEVEQQNGYAKIAVEIEKVDGDVDKDSLLSLFSTLPKIESQAELERLPQERRERWYRNLFDGMSEGVLSVDANGIINAANSVACRILGQSYEVLINSHVSETTDPKDCILAECIAKKIPINRRRSVNTDTGRVEYYGSAKPIFDTQGNFIGAVLLMKNLKEVQAMVDAVMTPAQITFSDFVGDSPPVRNLISFAHRIAKLDTIVSITGESGTGKELFAKALHFDSERSGPFIPINCAALPEPLIESELFGYADGAFTGARKKGKPGLFEAARNGTIFLDEIGEMPHTLQAKILRVLQDGLVRRIGGFDEIPVNARVLTATNKNLAELVEEGTFREDLFYRINVLTVQIPPLRERLGDIPLLVDAFLLRFNQRLEKPKQTLSQGALAKLNTYSWPGNVRELQNVIERASILSDGGVIHSDAILLNSEAAVDGKRAASKPMKGGKRPLKELVGDYEMEILLETLNSTSSIRKAAKMLGISHTALLKKIAKYELQGGNKTYHCGKNIPFRNFQ